MLCTSTGMIYSEETFQMELKLMTLRDMEKLKSMVKNKFIEEVKPWESIHLGWNILLAIKFTEWAGLIT